jgi:hypothetical protein
MPSLIPEQENNPGTHVLVIGVSEYLHFNDGRFPTQRGELLGMEQLSAAAHSASEFAAWMLKKYNNPNAPLSSLRVLLSPSENEVLNADVLNRLTGDYSATLGNVKAELNQFQNLCDLHKNNVAIVYIAGHGVQLSKKGSIVLLHDCGSTNHTTLLEGSIDMAGVHAGFDHPNTAQTQFWFVDACRQIPAIASRFENLKGGLTLDEPTGNANSNPMFLAATTGTQSFARVQGLTLFCEALLWGLNGRIATAPQINLSNNWVISTNELVMKLIPKVKSLAAAENAKQTADIAGRPIETVFHEYRQIPQVDLHVDLLPDTAANLCVGYLEDQYAVNVLTKNPPWPMKERIQAGLYQIKIPTVQGVFPNTYSKLLSLCPPIEHQKINMTS